MKTLYDLVKVVDGKLFTGEPIMRVKIIKKKVPLDYKFDTNTLHLMVKAGSHNDGDRLMKGFIA